MLPAGSRIETEDRRSFELLPDYRCAFPRRFPTAEETAQLPHRSGSPQAARGK